MSSVTTPSRAWAVGDSHADAAAGFAGRFDDVTVLTYDEVLGRDDVEHLDSVGLVLGADPRAVVLTLQALNSIAGDRPPRVWLRAGSAAQLEQLSGELAALALPWAVPTGDRAGELELTRPGSEPLAAAPPRPPYAATAPPVAVRGSTPAPDPRTAGAPAVLRRGAAALRRRGVGRRHLVLAALTAVGAVLVIALAGAVGGWPAALTVVGILVLLALVALLAAMALVLHLVVGLRRTVADHVAAHTGPATDDEVVQRLDTLRELVLASAEHQARAAAARD